VPHGSVFVGEGQWLFEGWWLAGIRVSGWHASGIVEQCVGCQWEGVAGVQLGVQRGGLAGRRERGGNVEW
jgi:hypothetical protein